MDENDEEANMEEDKAEDTEMTVLENESPLESSFRLSAGVSREAEAKKLQKAKSLSTTDYLDDKEGLCTVVGELPNDAKELVRVSKLGVQVHAWTCSISLEEIRLDAPLPIVLG